MELLALKEDCSQQKNVVFERHQLWSHQRTAGTSVDRFITELRQKSKDCEFGMSENDMLRDKLVFSITDSPLKERLLQERGLTLHRAIEICRVTEQVKTPLQAMKTEHGMKEVPVDAGMKRILPDQSLHHNTRKHLGHQSVQNMDQTEKLVLAAFIPKVQLHRIQLQQPSVTDCVFIERKNVEQQLPERLHIKEEPETLSEGQEGNQLCRQEETNSAACPVQCEDEEEKPQASQLHWRQQTETNFKEEPSTCTLDESMKRQTVGMNSKGPESARNPDPSSLVLQGTDGNTTDSPHTEDGNKDEEDNDYDEYSPKPLAVSEDESNDFFSTSKKRKMSASNENTEMRCKAAKTRINSFQQIFSNLDVLENVTSESITISTACVGGKKETLNTATNTMSHCVDKPFVCELCDKCYGRKDYLITHMRSHTGVKPFKCDICNNGYTQRSVLNVHMRSHTGEKPFECEVCGKRFSRSSYRNMHMCVHTGEKLYKCDVCNKCYKQKDQLRKHMIVHTGENPFVCQVCSKSFTQKAYLKLHMTIHTGEKPFICEVCHKSFSRRNYLKSHQKSHTGEKRYRCDLCSSSFKHKSNLNTHMRVHTGEKPYECYVCAKSFKHKAHLIKHSIVHAKEKPLEKPLECDKRINEVTT